MTLQTLFAEIFGEIIYVDKLSLLAGRERAIGLIGHAPIRENTRCGVFRKDPNAATMAAVFLNAGKTAVYRVTRTFEKLEEALIMIEQDACDGVALIIAACGLQNGFQHEWRHVSDRMAGVNEAAQGRFLIGRGAAIFS